MPIVVDEVVITIEVVGEPAPAPAPAGAEAAVDRRALVEECVERVLEVLRQREER